MGIDFLVEEFRSLKEVGPNLDAFKEILNARDTGNLAQLEILLRNSLSIFASYKDSTEFQKPIQHCAAEFLNLFISRLSTEVSDKNNFIDRLVAATVREFKTCTWYGLSKFYRCNF